MRLLLWLKEIVCQHYYMLNFEDRHIKLRCIKCHKTTRGFRAEEANQW
jgi:hypothetical protein